MTAAPIARPIRLVFSSCSFIFTPVVFFKIISRQFVRPENYFRSVFADYEEELI
jgi:hypothetical protein